MRIDFFFHLAKMGVAKNKKLFIPYVLTSSLMVCVFYLLSYLSGSSAIAQMHGGHNVQIILRLGSFVIVIFSVLFLFYTNSFIIRRRKKEYGLYHMLGMNKGNIGKIVFFETLIIFLMTVGLGIITGITVSKLSELVLLHFMREEINYSFTIPLDSVLQTILFYFAVDTLLFFNSLRQVIKFSSIKLIRSENTGEKPPNTNWVAFLVGIIFLSLAYYLAISIKQPLDALIWFFIAVSFVIIATYLLFISGSVAICKLMQKNKKYYYQPNHFVAVSSMVYRMKRNGAGLASICILLTMVLVMISSTTCLYYGKDDSLHSTFPREICSFAAWYGYGPENEQMTNRLSSVVEKVIEEEKVHPENQLNYYEYCISGYLEDSHLETSLNSKTNFAFIDYSKVAEVHFIDLADYNRMFHQQEILADGEAIACVAKTDDVAEVFSVNNLTYHIEKRVDDKLLDLSKTSQISATPSIFLIVNDLKVPAKAFSGLKDYNGSPMLLLRWYYHFDTLESETLSSEVAVTIENELYKVDNQYELDSYHLYCESREVQFKNFYSIYGGLFFIGILLSIVFLISMVLIIYYKQLVEGMEDQSKFEIMEKVGMSGIQIKQNIQSQIITVFFLPVALSVIHLTFAFPFIYKILMLFQVMNLKFLIMTAFLSVAGCIIFYLMSYRITAKTYFQMVYGSKNQ